MEPGRLCFGKASTSQEVPKASPAPAGNTAAPVPPHSSPEKKQSGPQALSFEGVVAPAIRQPGGMAFAEPTHPAQMPALAEARAANPALFLAHEGRIVRLVSQLLPLSKEKVESWGMRALETCKDDVVQAGQLTRAFAALESSRILNEALGGVTLKAGLIKTVLRHLGAPLSAHGARVDALRTSLLEVLTAVRLARTNTPANTDRLVCHLVALHAVVSASGTPPDAGFSFLIDQRLTTLRLAHVQMENLSLQLKGLEETLSMQLAECDRLTVLLAAQSSQS